MEKTLRKNEDTNGAFQVGMAVVSAASDSNGHVNKLKQQWLEELTDAIAGLMDKVGNLSPDKLTHNETFMAVCLRASRIALNSPQKEKMEALRNAVFNSLLPGAPEAASQMSFLDLIDELTPWHIRILELLDDPYRWLERQAVLYVECGEDSLFNFIQQCFSELRGNRDFIELLVRDLQAAGLLQQGGILHAEVAVPWTSGPWTAELGRQFVNFISRDRAAGEAV